MEITKEEKRGLSHNVKVFTTHFFLTIIISFLLYNYQALPVDGTLEFLAYMMIFILFWLTSILYSKRYFIKLTNAWILFFYFVRQLIMGNFMVVGYILSRKANYKPAIVKFPMRAETELEIMLLSNLITLTPGSLTIEVTRDRKYLFYHTVNVAEGDFELERKNLREGFEQKILDVTR